VPQGVKQHRRVGREKAAVSTEDAAAVAVEPASRANSVFNSDVAVTRRAKVYKYYTDPGQEDRDIPGTHEPIKHCVFSR
jgi:hypothetical protein